MRRAFLALLLAVWAALAGAQGLQPVPALAARVTDLAALLSAEQRGRLEERLAAFEREKGVQIAVLLVPTTQPESIEQYALRVAEQWRLGRQGVDDGVLLLVARDDRQLRIEVGYGLEGALNDATARRIIAETITPHFRERRFHEGIAAGVEGIVAAVSGEPLPPPRETARQAGGSFDFEDIFVLGLVLVSFVAGILRAIFGRFLGALIVGGLAGLIVMLVAASLAVAVLAGVVAFFLALLGGGSGGRGGLSWGGSGGGGFGGFSGGGGGFGGGGASGRW